MMRCLILLLTVFLLCPAWGARSFNGTSDGAFVECTGTQGGCNTICTGCTIPAIADAGVQSWNISFWLWENSWGSSDKLIIEQSANYNNRQSTFLIDSGGIPSGSACVSSTPYFAVNTDVGVHYRSRAWTAPSAAAWHHYLFIVDRTGASWALYIDGVAQSLINCDVGSPSTGNLLPDGVSLMSRDNASLFNGGKMARLAMWHDVILTANEAKSLASCVEPWLIRPENLAIYAPLYGHDSNEPSYAVSQGLRTTAPLTGTSYTNDPPACNGVL